MRSITLFSLVGRNSGSLPWYRYILQHATHGTNYGIIACEQFNTRLKHHPCSLNIDIVSKRFSKLLKSDGESTASNTYLFILTTAISTALFGTLAVHSNTLSDLNGAWKLKDMHLESISLCSVYRLIPLRRMQKTNNTGWLKGKGDGDRCKRSCTNWRTLWRLYTLFAGIFCCDTKPSFSCHWKVRGMSVESLRFDSCAPLAHKWIAVVHQHFSNHVVAPGMHDEYGDIAADTQEWRWIWSIQRFFKSLVVLGDHDTSSYYLYRGDCFVIR